MSDTYKGRCFCGAVEIEATGMPIEMGYCHCSSCRSYSGAPVVSFMLWQTENIRVIQGAHFLSGFNKTGMTDRKHCARCGGHVMSEHPSFGFTDVYAGVFRGLLFRPTVHLNYAEAVLPIKDGLPKLKDFPAEVGGSGEEMAE
ncbi:MAG: GFA family protein [Nitrospira sp.]